MTLPRIRAVAVAVAGAAIAAATLAACSASAPTPSASRARADSGLDRMERLALTANRCWFKSKDPAFAAYSLAPELSSFSGRPRFLLVPKGRPEAKPLLVVEGKAGSRAVSTYGPVMGTGLAGRVDADIRRWSAGSGACDA